MLDQEVMTTIIEDLIHDFCPVHRFSSQVSKGFCSTVHLLNTVYEKGVKVCGKERSVLKQRLQRLEQLPLYDITIRPKTV